MNPDELVNQDVKSNAVGSNRVHNVKQLIANVRAFLKARKRRPDLVQRYFLGTHVKYAAANQLPGGVNMWGRLMTESARAIRRS